MTQNKKVKKVSSNKKKRKFDFTSKVIVFGSLIIIIPFLILGGILISASLNTGKPILGDRFDGDLNPAITSSDLNDVKSSVEAVSSVESAQVNLKTSTLRVTVDVSDTMSEEDMILKLDEIYNAVLSKLDMATYFTSTSTKRMYDIDVNIHNISLDKSDSEEFILVGRVKNSMMDTYRDQVLSKALDEDLAQELRDDVENRLNPSSTPDDDEMTVGGLDDGNEIEESADPEGEGATE
ncbi:MAG: hypothetical protein ACK5KQ_01945 [Anaerorhabdus sp.]